MLSEKTNFLYVDCSLTTFFCMVQTLPRCGSVCNGGTLCNMLVGLPFLVGLLFLVELKQETGATLSASVQMWPFVRGGFWK